MSLSSALWSGGMFVLANAGGGGGFSNPENCMLVISCAVVVGVIIAVAAISRMNIKAVSSGTGIVFEMVYDFVHDMAVSMMGPVGKRFVPFCMSIFLFVLFSNWSGLLPMPAYRGIEPHDESLPLFECPTSQFSVTLAMAMVSFLCIIFFGMRKYMFGAFDEETRKKKETRGEHVSHGSGVVGGFFGWWTHFLHPVPDLWKEMAGAMKYLLLPVLACLFVALNIIEELARLISLSIRLYGNLHGEHVVKTNLISALQDFLHQAGQGGFAIVGYGVMSLLMWGCSFFVTCIGTLAGFIQAYVFFVLTLSYISHVAADEH